MKPMMLALARALTISASSKPPVWRSFIMAAVQPRHAARLHRPVEQGDVDHLVGRHALPGVARRRRRDRVVAGVARIEPVRDGPLPLVDLDAHADLAAFVACGRPVVHQLVGLDDLQANGTLLPPKDLQIMRTSSSPDSGTRHDHALDVLERQAAGRVAELGALPALPLRLDRGVDLLVQACRGAS
jgi:hypothetical protein